MANDDTSVGIPVTSIDSIDEKVAKIKELVDNLQAKYNIDDEQLTPKVNDNINDKQLIRKELFKDNYLNQLKDILTKVYKLEKGRCQSDNGKLIQEFFNYCVAKCIKEEKLESMIVVTVLLPDLVTKSYKSAVTNLVMQLSYVKIPSKWCKGENTFHSVCENLCSYKFPESSPPQFDRWEKIPLHPATLCYAPLPGFCTYPEDSSVLNTLFPHHLSPFAKLVISNLSDVLDISHAFSGSYESAPIQAIIKFKWHAFARRRFFIMLFIYLSHSILHVAAIFKTNETTEGRWLMIANLILKVIMILNFSRYTFISALNNVGIRLVYPLLTLILPVITGFLFLYSKDTSDILTIFQATTVFLIWVGFIVHLVVFKNIGILLAAIKHTCRKILWVLVLLAIILFSVTHSEVTFLYHNKGIDIDEEYKTGTVVAFYKSFASIWDFFLSDYSFLVPFRDYHLFYLVYSSKIVFSIFTTVIILNLLIAIVHNAYKEVLQHAHAEWTMMRAKYIVLIELLFMKPSERQNGDYFPLTITYEAFTEDVNKWPKKLKEDCIPIPWEDIGEMIKKKEEMIKRMTDELEKLRQNL